MYREGSYKWPFAIIFAVLVALGFCYWPQTKFILKFLWDLLLINLDPLIKAIHAKIG
jgi:hypothetical protein